MEKASAVRPRSARSGLTLVELVVVLAVVAILAGLLLPAAASARSRSRRMQCAHNLKGLGESLAMFSEESAGRFPDVYYRYSGAAGSYEVALRDTESDRFFSRVDARSLLCPHDRAPATVLARDSRGRDANVKTSYAYNISLPTLYRNLSRVHRTANVVTFYDGDASAVVGAWNNAPNWSTATIRPRHGDSANYLFVDGHVEELPGIDESLAFTGGAQWTASALDTIPKAPAAPEEEPTLPDLPALPPDIGLFGDECIIFGAGASIDESLTSNGFIQLGNGAQVRDIACGGPVTSGSHPVIAGSVLCGDSVNITGGTISGDVDAAGTIVADGIGGDAAAGGNVSIADTAFGRVYSLANVTVGTASGRIIAGGDVTVSGSAVANIDAGGNVIAANAGGDIVCAGTATVNGTASGVIEAGGDVTANVASAGVVSGGNVTLQGVSSGNVDAAGDVSLEKGLTGTVQSGGMLTLGTKETLTGSAWAGNGALIDDKAVVTGNLSVSGNVIVDKQAKVNGSVQYTGTLTLNNGAKVLGGSTKVASVVVTPAAPSAPLPPPAPVGFSPVSLPSPTAFSAGGEDVIEANGATVEIEPGKYGQLSLGTQCTLKLASGAYYFTSFTVGNNLNLYFDCSDGNVQIYVSGDVALGTMSALGISGGGPQNVFIETHGRFSTVNGSRWEGAVFAPNGDIELAANCTIRGALFSGAQLILGNGVVVHYVAPAGS
jgi:prepilin-type processing-associated H-X9-DG protein/prepilin-type N-terminal cleavage/methylation domain-containing protein